MRAVIVVLLCGVLLAGCGPETPALEEAHLAARSTSLVGACNPAPCRQLFMNPTGDDTRDGLTEATSVKSLTRIHSLLATSKYLDASHVEVRIAPGTYLGQHLTWTVTSANDYTLTFLPSGYTYNNTNPGRPIFDGHASSTSTAPADNYLFYLNKANGKPSRIRFYYLQIQNYATGGLAFVGKTETPDETNWNGYNTVFGCSFYRLGTKWGGTNGYGGISLVNSRYNTIDNSLFVNLENAAGEGGLIHAIYMKDHANYNVITRSKFEYVSGDAIRARNESNFNKINDNIHFLRAGETAFYGDWYCDASKRTDCAVQECPSWQNEFKYNELRCGYTGASLPTFFYHQGETYVPSRCTNRTASGWRRLTTASNGVSCP
jgi:hypothetical protein